MKNVLLLLLFIAGCLPGQSWTNIGPASESPDVIEYDPNDANRIIAGSIGSISISEDGGVSWKVLFTFEDNNDYTAAAIEFGDGTPGNYYVSGMVVYDPDNSANGVYRTTDGGESFEQILSAPSVGLRIHPLDADIMVNYYDDFEGSVYRTTDGGATWTNIGAGSLENVRNIAMDPFDTQTIYASTFGGLLKSTDGGATWASSGFNGTNMFLMETHPTIPGRVYTGTGVFVSPEAFYVSEDAGGTWTEISLPYGDFVIDLPRKLKFAASDPNVMYLGETNEIFYSGNGGQTWSKRSFPERVFFFTLGLTVNPEDPSIAMATSDTKSVMTSNSGTTWENFALPLNNVLSMEVLADGDIERIYAGTYYGNLRYDSDTGEWTDYTNPGFIGIESKALGVDPEMPELLLTGVQNGLGQSIINRSVDYGESEDDVWNNFTSGGGSPAALKNDPLNSGVFYFATISSFAQDQLIKSSDYGETWQSLSGGQFTYTDITVDYVNSGTVYVSGDGLVTKSTDGGTTFLPANAGLPAAYGVYCIDISPFNPDILVCSNDLGVYRTDDGGANWELVLSGISCKNVEFSKSSPGIAALVSWGDQVLLSTDDGSTWDDFQGDLPLITLSDVRFSADGTALYVSTLGQSIYKSALELSAFDISCSLTLSSSSGNGDFDAELLVTNSAAVEQTFDIWMSVSGPNGYNDEVFSKLDKTLKPDTSKLQCGRYRIDSAEDGIYNVSVYIGTYPGEVESSCSVTYTKSSTLAGQGKGAASLIPAEMELAQNFPNPFNPVTTIRFGLPAEQHVRLTIYDLLGQEVASLVNTTLAPGYHSVDWNGRNRAGQAVSSGIYIYKLDAGESTRIKRMLFTK